jgi:chromosomal replication initiation ATPase DnaA
MRLELADLTATAEAAGAGPFIESLVSAAFGLNPAALREPRRGAERVALARQIGMYLAHTRLGLNYTAAGALFGRDRTTAAHAVREIEERRENLTLDSMLDCLERSVDVWPRSLGGAARDGR